MPDEVVFTAGAKATPPAGTKIATDTVAGKEIQFVKLDIGGDGVSSPVAGSVPVFNVSGTSVNVTVSGTHIQYVTGTVSVQNFPTLQGISGTVFVSNFPLVQDVALVSGSVSVTSPIQQGISGTVAVSNFPALQGVSGSVSVNNFPVQQGISGTVFVGNFPAQTLVTGSVGIVGNVNIGNYPNLQGVSGTVFVSNFPLIQDVAIVSGSVSVTPPISQGISGSVSISNFPVQQGISGTVTVANIYREVTGTVSGNVPHDGVDAGAPVKVGAKAVAYGSSPSAVAANDRTDLYANRHGVQFVIGGHPNAISTEVVLPTTGSNNYALITGSGNLIAVTQIQFTCDNANTVDVAVRAGFHASATPTGTGVILTHPGVAAGSGISRGDGGAVIGQGAANQGLFCTTEPATSGGARFLITYFVIDG